MKSLVFVLSSRTVSSFLTFTCPIAELMENVSMWKMISGCRTTKARNSIPSPVNIRPANNRNSGTIFFTLPPCLRTLMQEQPCLWNIPQLLSHHVGPTVCKYVNNKWGKKIQTTHIQTPFSSHFHPILSGTTDIVTRETHGPWQAF